MGSPTVQTYDTLENKQAFLEALEENLTFYGAAKVAGISRMSVYRWMDEDPLFKDAVAKCKELATQRLEQSMYDRAVKSDTIAGIFLLKSLRPQTYRDDAQRQPPVNVGVYVFSQAPTTQLPEQAPSRPDNASPDTNPAHPNEIALTGDYREIKDAT